MATVSTDLATTLATIAVKAHDISQGLWSTEDCVAFAWFSVNQPGDASIDQADFIRHIGAWVREEGR